MSGMPETTTTKNEPLLELSLGQEKAKTEIFAAMKARQNHLLLGYAGTGKTTLLKTIVHKMLTDELRVAVCAPTNKAVAVVERMLRDAGVKTYTSTIFSLLGLTPGNEDAKRKPKRVGENKSRKFDVVIIDECSMIGEDIYSFIQHDLRQQFVLFIGDPAQLPPVGESISPTFLVPSKSELIETLRQAAGNPIIALSSRIREMIAIGEPDWEAFQPEDIGDTVGIFAPPDADEWVDSAFLSVAFSVDNDAFRCLAWTNKRVGEINRRIRLKIYGETETPFIPGERVLLRSRVMDETNTITVINTNDEATIVSLRAGVYSHSFDPKAEAKTKDGKRLAPFPAWTADLAVWDVQLENRFGDIVDCRIAQYPDHMETINKKLVSESNANSTRWWEYFAFNDAITKMQSIYCMTVHCSQGSTFENVFVDMNDCLKNSNTMEKLRLLYVAVTRPSRTLILI